MTTLQYLHQHVIPSAYALLPPAMNSKDATAMLLAICLQESRAEHRRQVTGPARSFLQFELAGVSGVSVHKASAPYLRLACQALRVTPMPTSIFVAIEHNDTLAFVCGRLLLYTLPDVLPTKEQSDEAYQQYLRAWRPGRPRPASWKAHYEAAWAMVEAA